MSRPASQALGGFFKTQDEIRPLICRRFAVQSAIASYCVCDPCAGEGEAVVEIVNHIFGPLKDRRRPVYGNAQTKPEVSLVMVELEEERYRRAESAGWGCSDLRQCHRGDGLCCDASGGCSLLWLNPPYDFFRGQRFEARFLDAWTPRIVGGGQLVLIVPEHALSYLAQTLTTWFDDLEVLRYPEPTYSEFKQVVVLGQKRVLAGPGGALPDIGNLADEPRTLRVVPPGALTVDVNALDVAALRAATTPWGGQAGYARPATPPQIGLAMRPKPAHVAMALGSGVFNGVRLSASGQPDILAKAVFHRQFVDADSKKDENGEVVKLTQVERPQLRLTTLDLSSGEYRELSPATEPSGKMENFADLLLAYGDSMVAAMRERCPSLHEGQEDVPLRPMTRSLFPAQAAAVRAALKLVARGMTPLVLGEIGSGKTSCALSYLWNLNDTAAQNAIRGLPVEHEAAFPPLARVPVVRRALVVCPPHLVKNWQDEARACLPGVPVVVLERVSDVEAAAQMTAPLVLCVLSREQAKLGHGVEGIAGKHCPRCGRPMAGDQEKRGKSRAICDKHVSEPLDVLARIAWDMRRGGSHGRRAAIVPLLRLLRAGTSRKKESWGGYSHPMAGEMQTKLVEMLKLCAPDPRVLRCLRRIYPPTVKYGQSIPTEQTIVEKFEHKEDDATLRRALAELGKWKTVPCGEPLYQAVPQPRRFPLADYICRKYPKLFQLMVPDECFVAGTLVSGRPIETIAAGDSVLSYTEAGVLEYKKVVRVYKKRATALCRVTIDGVVLNCTLQHPFLTQRGWVAACALDARTDIVLRSVHENTNIVHWSLQPLPKVIHRRGSARVHHSTTGIRVLLPGVRTVGKKRRYWSCQQKHVARKPGDALRANDSAQPIQIARDASQNQRSAQRQTLRSTWRQRQAYGATVGSVEGFGFTDRNGRLNERSGAYFREYTDILQGGRRPLGNETGNRGRWQGPSDSNRAAARPEEDRGFVRARVDRVEILEQTSDGTFGGVCPDGFVYNLEVESTHNYFANSVLVHNCHEYGTDGSAQERAIHRLSEKIPLKLPLTGSLMNGYAKSLFRNMWSFSRRMREEFAYDEHGKFCKLYGYQKRVLTGDALKKAVVTEFGGSSDRVVKTEGGERLSDAPGVLPSFVLRHVLPLSVTLHKRDITPDDRVVDHDRAEIPIVDAIHASNGYALGVKLKDAVTRDRYDEHLAGKLFGQLAEYPSYFDRATDDTGNAGPSDARSYEIRYPKDVGGNLVSAAAGLPRANKLAKEEWLVSLLRKELAEGRNVLIFLWHKELADRLIGLCREVGEVPAFLDANKVQAKKRQDWIDKNVVGKRRIMITNPSCVQTGLNNLIWFSSAVFFENPGCNPFVARQAVGRLDRITQTKEVRVYWPVYEGVQCALLDLLQAKTAISQQIDGIDPTAALEMAGAGDGAQVQTQDVGLAVYKYLGGD